jgi:uncharacterized protein involved in exopolysaccharide biosynthesis
MDDFDEIEEKSGLPEFLMDPRGVLRRRWHWMLAVLLVGAVAAAVFVALIPQTYQASARLLLTHQRIPEEFVRPTSMERIPELVNALVGEILSRESLIAIAETHNLAERLNLGGSAPELIRELRSGITVEPDMDMEDQTRRRRSAGEDIFILATRFESSDPVVAADVANELASRFSTAHLRRQNRQAKLTSDFLRGEAERAEAKLAEQRALITEFKNIHRGELPSELDTKLARLERLQQQSQSLAVQISDAEGRLLTLQSQELAPAAQETLLEELRTRLVHERTIYTDEHPNVIALQRQIEGLEAQVAGSPRGAPGEAVTSARAAAEVQREIDSLRAQAQDVEQEIQVLDAAVATIPVRHEELEALEQQEALLLERFVAASRKVQEAELAESLQHAQQGFQVSQLEVAVPPSSPLRDRSKFAVLAVIAVLGASVMTGLALEFVDPVVLAARQLEARTGALSLGVVPRIR